MSVVCTRRADGVLEIDGSSGEGGGQILRSSLALSAITKTPIEMKHIRGKRPKPGLQRQHTVCVQAAAQICGASVEGGEEGSTVLRFTPGATPTPCLASYSFDIGTAGSSTLVLATILPILWAGLREAPATVRISGGTHNPHAPCVDFLVRTLLPALRAFGLGQLEVASPRLGFYPAGGGLLVCTISPLPTAAPPPAPAAALPFSTCSAVESVGLSLLTTRAFPAAVAKAHTRALAAAAGLPCEAIGQRSVEASGSAACALAEVQRSPGEGGTVEVCAAYSERRGQSSEDFAGALWRDACRLKGTAAPLSHHTADQLVLPLLLFSAGAEYVCESLEGDAHFSTNVGVCEAFLGGGLVSAESRGAGEGGGGGGGEVAAGVRVRISPRAYFGGGAAERAALAPPGAEQSSQEKRARLE
jgi:RNA 3'-terminal phosphate cyclase (ATP)